MNIEVSFSEEELECLTDEMYAMYNYWRDIVGEQYLIETGKTSEEEIRQAYADNTMWRVFAKINPDSAKRRLDDLVKLRLQQIGSIYK